MNSTHDATAANDRICDLVETAALPATERGQQQSTLEATGTGTSQRAKYVGHDRPTADARPSSRWAYGLPTDGGER